MSWRFYLLELPSRRWVDKDLPLIGAKVVEADSTPASISGDLPLGHPGMMLPTGEPLITEWGYAIVAEQAGREPVFAIVDEATVDGDNLSLQAGGFAAYPAGMPWMGAEFTGIQVDPLDMVRKIWDHLQSYENGYLEVTVDETTSPVRIGTEIEEVSFTTGTGELVEFEAGPFRLARWHTEDLGGVIDKLAEETPFEYREHSSWAPGDRIVHRLEIGYPTLGVRRRELHFEVGINVIVPPPAAAGDYASEIWMQGAGEGRERLKTSAHLTVPTKRLRRVHVETDKSIRSMIGATRAGRPILDRLSGKYTLDTVQVIDHDLARHGTYFAGDEIRIVGDAGWVQLDTWVRVLEIEDDCTTGSRTLKVETV